MFAVAALVAHPKSVVYFDRLRYALEESEQGGGALPPKGGPVEVNQDGMAELAVDRAVLRGNGSISTAAAVGSVASRTRMRHT